MQPRINSHVELRDRSGRTFDSRVENVEGRRVTVARPDHFPSTEGYGAGIHVDLLWAVKNGVYAQPCMVAENKHENNVSLWVLEPSGELSREQRRSYVRLNLGIPMTMALTEGEETTPFRCVLLDVSEAALRCRVTPDEAEKLEKDTIVRAGFTIDQTAFAMTGAVLRTKLVEAEDHRQRDSVEVIVMFDVDEALASQLRRAVFAEQIRLRNLSPDL